MQTLLQISASLERRLGGPFEVVSNSHFFLKKFFIADILVIGNCDPSIEAEFNCQTLFGNRFGFIIKLPIEIKNQVNNSDIVLFHGFYLFSIFHILLLRRHKSLVIMPHGSLERYESRKSAIKKLIFRFLFRLMSRNVNFRFIVATQSEIVGVKKLFPFTNVSVVGLGINKQEINIKSDLSLHNPMRLIFLSRVASKKRVDILIRALKELPRGEFILSIVGDGRVSLLSKLKKLVENLELQNEVNFLGFLQGNDKVSQLHNSDLFILPSENENFAVAAAESVASGVPVIVSRYVAFSSFVLDHNTGIVLSNLNPKNLAAEILEIRRHYPIYVEACEKASRYLSWEQVAKVWSAELAN